MKRSLPLLATMLAIGLAPSVHAQAGTHTLRMNLANPILTRTVAPGTYQFLLVNRLPGIRYDIEILREFIPIPASELPAQIPVGAVETCETHLVRLRQALVTTATEVTLRNTLQTWKSGLDADCQRRGDELFQEETTEDLRESYTLLEGQRLRVRISRRTASGTGTGTGTGATDTGGTDTGVAEWEFVISTEPRGEWRTLYGLTFVPDHDDHFFADQVEGEPTKFVIRRERDSTEGLASQFLPSILLAWYPTRYRVLDWVPGVVGGVGYNVDRLAVLGGFAMTYNENLTFTVGAAMHQQSRLNGRYRPGDTITGQMDNAQLHAPKYMPNVYFGIALRLGRDPFQRAGEPQESGKKPDPESPAPVPEAPGNPEPTPGSTQVDPAAVKVGDKIGAYEVASVTGDEDNRVVTFSEMQTSVEGTYALVGTTPCIELDPSNPAKLPMVGSEGPQSLCFNAGNTAAFEGITADRAVTVTFHSLRIAFSPTADPVFTATGVSVTPK